MDITEMNTPTLEECLALLKKKDWLRAEVAELELERRELQSAVDDLSTTYHRTEERCPAGHGTGTFG